MPRVQVQIVTWNSRKDIRAAIDSVRAQTWRDVSIVIIDNASEDGTQDILKEYGTAITVIFNRNNFGFARAHNQGFALAIQSRNEPEYILVMNPDSSLTPRFLETLIPFAEKHPDGASFCGKVLREISDGAATIDTAGLLLSRGLTAYDRGSGEVDRGQYNHTEHVFGASGALALYRVASLKTVAPDGALYDPDFFMYKEDVDLAWRLERAGYCAYYVSEALAYHSRTVRAPQPGLIQRIRGEINKDPMKKYLSYRNQWLLLLKNMSMRDWFRHLPWVIGSRMTDMVFMGIVHPRYLVRAHLDIMRIRMKSRKAPV